MISGEEVIEQVDYDEESPKEVEDRSIAPAVVMEEDDAISEVTTRSHTRIVETVAVPSDMDVEGSLTGKRSLEEKELGSGSEQ